MTSCADSDADPSPTAPAPSRPATSTTPPPSDTEVAAAAATAVLRLYYKVRNQVRRDHRISLGLLESVAISSELAAQRTLFQKERKEGLRQVGNTEVVQLKVQSVSLDNSDPKAGKVPTVQIDLCFDVTDVDVVDASGASVISPDRPDTGWIQFLVANYGSSSEPAAGWRVASSRDIERKPCEAS